MDANKKRHIEKLMTLAHRIECGCNAQITKLYPIRKLVDRRFQCMEYYLFLAECSFCYYRGYQSLSTVELIERSKKEEMYNRSLVALSGLRENEGIIKYGKDLIDIYQFFQSTFPGWKRISVHASRRKLEDPDLVLLEQTIRYSLNGWYGGDYAYFLSRYFCSNYIRYRFFMQKESSSRVIDIAQYFSHKYLCEEE